MLSLYAAAVYLFMGAAACCLVVQKKKIERRLSESVGEVAEEYEELVRQIDASLCFTMITMAGIVINAVVVGLFIFAQPRYMIYGMGLFYTACCMIAWDLYACWRKGILYKF